MDASAAGEGKLAFTLRMPIGVVGAISPFNFPLNLVAHKLAPAIAAGLPGRAEAREPDSALGDHARADPARRVRAARRPPQRRDRRRRHGRQRDRRPSRHRADHVHRLARGRLGHPRPRAAQEGRPRARQQRAADHRAERRRRDRGARRCRSRASRTRASRASRRSASTCTSRYASGSSTRSSRSSKGSSSATRSTRRTDVSALISTGERDRVQSWVDEAVAGGAEILAGGKVREDGVLAPTVLGGVTPDMKVCADEVFGPVVGVATYTDLDDALRLANDSRYGLQAAIFTADLTDALQRRPHARLRRRARERGADVPRRPAAVRRQPRQRQHARRPAVGRARDDRGTPRHHPDREPRQT